MPRFRVAYANCAKWDQQVSRWPKLVRLLKRQHASVYLLTEAPEDFLRGLAGALGWTKTKGDQVWETAPNRNALLWNPRKWRYLRTASSGLSETPGDLADLKNRSALWVLLEHRRTGAQSWFGASHLSPHDAADARLSQARALVAGIPGTPLLLGVDRNTREGTPPERALRQGMTLLTPGLGDTFSGRDGVQNLDGLYGVGVALRWLRKVWPGTATDHVVLRAGATTTEGVDTL